MPYEFHKKLRKLSDAEILEAKEAVVEHLQEIQTLEGELAVQKKKYSEKLKPHKTLVRDLMKQISTGVDEGQAYCRVIVDAVTKTVRFVVEKREWNDETQRYDTIDELFDEKTFEEVGERQLTIWQSGDDIDPDDDDRPELSAEEEESLMDLLTEQGMEAHHELIQDCLYFPTDDLHGEFLEATGEPYSKVRIAYRGQGLAAALNVISEALAIEDYERYSQLLFGALRDDVPVPADEILGKLIDWAAAQTAEEDAEATAEA